MTKPIRIQRKRTKGWSMPPNTVYVGRGSIFGNPFKVGLHGDAKECVDKYINYMLPYSHEKGTLYEFYISVCNLELIQTLKGKNLACWCKENEICHGDWLIEIANNGRT